MLKKRKKTDGKILGNLFKKKNPKMPKWIFRKKLYIRCIKRHDLNKNWRKFHQKQIPKLRKKGYLMHVDRRMSLCSRIKRAPIWNFSKKKKF